MCVNGNTCRSVLAEHIAKSKFRFDDQVAFESAGISPQNAAGARAAIDVLQAEYGINAATHVPRDIRSLRLKRYSLIVALDAAIVSTIQDLVGTDGVQIEKWDIPNRRGFH